MIQAVVVLAVSLAWSLHIAAPAFCDERDCRIAAISISPDGKWLLTALSEIRRSEEPRAIGRLWSLESGNQVAVFVGTAPQEIRDAAVSPDGKYVAFSGLGSSQMGPSMLSVWSAEQGELLTEQRNIEVRLAFTPNSKSLVLANPNAIATIDLASGRFEPRVFSNTDCLQRVTPIIPSDNSEVLVGTRNQSKHAIISSVSLTTGRVLREYSDPKPAIDADTAVACAVSPDRKYVVTCQSSSGGGKDSAIVVWDRAKGTEIRRFSGFIPHAAAFTADGSQVLGISIGGRLVAWSIETGEIVHELFPQVPRLGQLENLVFRREYDRRERPELYPVIDFRRDGKYFVAASRNTNDLAVHLISATSGFKAARFHHLPEPRQWWSSVGENGRIIAKSDALNIPSRPLKERDQHRLPGPDSVEDEAKVAEALARISMSGKTPIAASTSHLPRLFFLGVGVGQHAIDDYNLKWTGNDIKEISNLFRSQEKKHYADVIVKELRDKTATAKAILVELDGLVRSSTAEDVVVISFAGHGVRGRKGLYFVPHEGDLESISTCVNWADIAERVSSLKSGKILVLLDCCHAGAFGNDRLPMHNEIAAKLKGKKSALILTASQGDQPALESNEKEHGLFSLKVIEALQGDADKNSDGKISMRELTDYVVAGVAEETDQQQTPQIEAGENFDFQTIVAHSVRKAQPTSDPVKLPAVKSLQPVK